MKPSGLGLLFFCLLMIGLFTFPISSLFSVEGCTFLSVCPFLPGCRFHWHIIALSKLPMWFSCKEFACNAGDVGSIPGLGRSPGEGNGNPLQYSCLEGPMDGGAWLAAVHGFAKSWTRLSDFTFTFTFHVHALEKEMAIHSSVLAWRIPGTGEPGGLLSMGSHRVGHN